MVKTTKENNTDEKGEEEEESQNRRTGIKKEKSLTQVSENV